VSSCYQIGMPDDPSRSDACPPGGDTPRHRSFAELFFGLAADEVDDEADVDPVPGVPVENRSLTEPSPAACPDPGDADRGPRAAAPQNRSLTEPFPAGQPDPGETDPDLPAGLPENRSLTEPISPAATAAPNPWPRGADHEDAKRRPTGSRTWLRGGSWRPSTASMRSPRRTASTYASSSSCPNSSPGRAG